MLELLCLACAATLWSASSAPLQGALIYAIIVLLALGMGVQAIAALTINSRGINTIVFTSALIRIVTSAVGDLIHNRSAARVLLAIGPDLGTFAGYVCGAILAGILILHHLDVLIWIPTAAVVLALAIPGVAEKPEAIT